MKKMSTMMLSVLSFCLFSLGVTAQSVGPVCAPNFGAAQNESTVVGAVRSALIDFDRDGKTDLITVDNNGVPSTRFRTESGFSEPVVSDYMQGIYHPTAIAIGYFDGDYIEGQFVVNPYPDIAVATAEGGVYLLTSDPYGYYSFRGTPVMQGFYAALAAVDFNEDGMSDLIAVDIAGGAVTLFSQADGNWGAFAYTPTTAAAYATGEVPLSASVGYFDGILENGIFFVNDVPDLAVVTSQGRVLLYTSDASGHFSVRETNFGVLFAEVQATDFNQDGRSDLVAKDAAGTVYVLLRLENGDFDAPHSIGDEQVASLIGTLDLNGDGTPDIVTTAGVDAHFAWFGSNGSSCSGVA